MLAAVFHGDGVLRLEERPEPVVEAPDDVIIEVEACGVCGSDLQILNVPPGHPATPGTILGHEFIGRVVKVGPVAASAVAVGTRVAVDPDPKCGYCRFCRAGRPAACENVVALGVFRDGALARFVSAPASAVFPIADSIPAPIGGLIEPLACVVNGVEKANPRPGESAVVYGAGTIGCLFLATIAASGATPVYVVEPVASRHAVPRAMGAAGVFTPEEWEARRHELLPSGADVLVDAVGTQLQTAVEHAALGGRIVLFGQNQTVRPAVDQYTITHHSLSILGSFITHFTFPTAIRLVETGALPLAPIVTHVVPLADTLEGLALLRSGSATKVVITP